MQRDKPVNVWGWGSPGEAVTVNFGETSVKGVADSEGKWKVILPPQKTSAKPQDLVVSGKNTITLTDVLVGEVWIGAGQSNMFWPVSESSNPKQEIAGANYPNIRLFQIPMVPSGTPAEDVDAKWERCSPETVAKFSAVLYSFGREIHTKLENVPIGLIQTAWSGTKIEAWTPPAGFAAIPTIRKELDKIEELTAAHKSVQHSYVAEIKNWTSRAEKAISEGKTIAPPPVAVIPKHPLDSHHSHTGLYNGMVHAIVPYTIRGVTWYQGEQNVPDKGYYAELMKGLIKGWRTIWGQGDFPFYYVQIAPFNYPYPGSFLPELREAQTKVLAVPNTGMVVTMDIGDLFDIHPLNKREVGRRLSLVALAKDYGFDEIEHCGPMYAGMSVEGNHVRIRFDHAAGLSTHDGQPLSWFFVAGEDKAFIMADAEIEGETVLLHSPLVKKPVAVRYGWHQLAETKLVNSAGLPAVPFRTDNWTETPTGSGMIRLRKTRN
ncbi:MAG: sialate O-acetylesterase [Planctomycetales bacterium]